MSTSLTLPAAKPALRLHADAQLLLIACLWFSFSAIWRPLFLPDEGRYIGVALEMLDSGDWLIPTLNGLPFFHKPPLFYWLSALAMKGFGVNAWAARLPSALAASALLCLLHQVLREHWGASAARRSVLVLATMPLLFIGAQFGNMDMLVASLIGLSVLWAARASLRQQSGHAFQVPLLLAYVSAGMAVLAKGLIGIVLPALIITAWLLWLGKGRALRALVWLPGIAALMLLVLPWPLLVEARHPGFLHYFLIVQHAQRFAGQGFNNVQPLWFYPAVLLIFTLPWSLAWLSMARLRALLSIRRRAHPDALQALLLCWLLVPLLFFSLPASKLIGYILPVLPALAALIGNLDLQGRRYRHFRLGLAATCCLALQLHLGVKQGNSAQGLALQLSGTAAPTLAAGQPVAVLDDYVYDLGFYLGHHQPQLLVSDWSADPQGRPDNGHKALAEAARFDPTQARRVLISPERLAQDWCQGRIAAVLASPQGLARHAALAGARALGPAQAGRLWWLPTPDTPACRRWLSAAD